MTCIEVASEISGTVWKVLKAPGDPVRVDEPVMVVESMKMEVPVIASQSGVIREVRVQEGEIVSEGDVVVTLDV